jgi:acyl carrier protein phosphodiesterase
MTISGHDISSLMFLHSSPQQTSPSMLLCALCELAKKEKSTLSLALALFFESGAASSWSDRHPNFPLTSFFEGQTLQVRSRGKI